MKVTNIVNFPLHFTMEDKTEVHLFPRDSEGVSSIELTEEQLKDTRIRNHVSLRNISITEG